MTKLKLKFNSLSGFVDPISIIGSLFLLITLVVGTKVASDKGFSLNIIEQAKKAEKTGNAAFDKCREESGREVCNERLGTNINWKGEDKTVYEQPVTPAPEAPAAIVPTSNTLEKEEIDFINKVSKEQAVVQQPKQESPVVVINNELEKEETAYINEVTQQETKQQAVTQTQVVDQPTVTAVTTPVSPFASVTVGVTSRTVPATPKPYTPPETYTPPLLTVPAFTVEDLLRKLPGLENLNINDFKELNYPTINKPDPAIITNKYGIVGAYANDPVRCKYGNGAIKEGDGKYACPTDTFANPILDNSQNISWYDQPLDIPALEFNLESTKPTIESEIKKLTDPLFNYILDYFSKYLPGISLP